MVIHHFYIVGIAALEAKVDAVAAPDRNGMSTLAVAGQSMDLVSSLALDRRDLAAPRAFQHIVDLVVRDSRKAAQAFLASFLVARLP